mgnify:CR=1 FL=1
MTEVVSRRKIMRACKSRGWMVQPAALKAMHQHLNLLDKDYTEDILEDLARHVEKNTKLITEAIWEKAMESTEDTVMIKEDGGLEIIDAFKTPRLVYDSMRKTFRVEEKDWPLLGDTADKVRDSSISGKEGNASR